MTTSVHIERVAANPMPKRGRGHKSGMEGASQTSPSQVVDRTQEDCYVIDEDYYNATEENWSLMNLNIMSNMAHQQAHKHQMLFSVALVICHFYRHLVNTSSARFEVMLE